MYTPDEILSISIENGQKKIRKPLVAKLILGFIGGAMISLGYLAYVRVSASITADLASVQALVGAAVFPIGLIVILMAGGELITGNMMAVSTAWFAKKVSFRELIVNWVTITLANIVGALFVAYFFGHYLGLTSSGSYLNQVLSLAEHKVAATWLQAIISGIGCNWFVGLALWLCYGAKDAAGKLLGIWFPVMIFVAIGFQHSVANAFIIPAAIFEGGVQWGDFFRNFIFVYLGNIIGGAIFVSGFYYLSYRKH
ncbi:formate/nitrite transporter family protein [Enterococcus faecalis]|uniref:formate/nitrite transporter family protein n=1 Tax=Enterococcus faecalis TaxID=1351 RepID=UPI00032DB45C|nr:formate/nitrite transporter family protein [Enterococcus faecalis]EGO2729203.1 formate/nitrite transporter family protein [Enterococcus faecalis]EGO2807990.1 formate/nitrite transporter family protein [Enterococcus faecalis]EGO6647996.1 formate/nitrite transporter family protein [Enterococcus faecalis]EGO7661013.1 formate/nitrite transporter family protein [Enterococcus faecalis]EGO7893955.1 formate/nitrite transporter family protein [Enterococcus faecalis]